jgi:hypothetical protein
MKTIVMFVMPAIFFGGCILQEKTEESTPPPIASDWTGNPQEWHFLSSVQSDKINLDPDRCDFGDWNPLPVRYRLRGDSLDLGWSFVSYGEYLGEEEDPVPQDTFWFGGTYVRDGSGTTVFGAWTLVEHRPWDVPSAASEEVQEQIERWNFLYANEKMFLGSNLLLFGYPRFWTMSTRSAEYDLLEDESISFAYIGTDSLLVSRESAAVGLKYKIFDSFHATSNQPGIDPIHASLTDSCAYPGAFIDTTWVGDFIWDRDDDEEEWDQVEKVGLFKPGTRRIHRSSTRKFHH